MVIDRSIPDSLLFFTCTEFIAIARDSLLLQFFFKEITVVLSVGHAKLL
jgi:hypothetical protein